MDLPYRQFYPESAKMAQVELRAESSATAAGSVLVWSAI